MLTDGEDNKSRVTLQNLLTGVRSNAEGERLSARIFTIGYGNEYRRDVLEQIADVTQARFFAGTPQNIREVFKEISTFF